MLETRDKESFDKNLQLYLAVVVQVMIAFRVHTPCIISGLYRRLGVTPHFSPSNSLIVVLVDVEVR